MNLSPSSKTYLYIALSGVVGLAIGYWAGSRSTSPSSVRLPVTEQNDLSGLKPEERIIAEAQERAQRIVDARNTYPRTVSGTISAVDGKQIILSNTGEGEDLRIKFSSETTVTLETSLDREVIDKAMEEYRKARSEWSPSDNLPPPERPSLSTTTSGTSSDIVAGVSASIVLSSEGVAQSISIRK